MVLDRRVIGGVVALAAFVVALVVGVRAAGRPSVTVEVTVRNLGDRPAVVCLANPDAKRAQGAFVEARGESKVRVFEGESNAEFDRTVFACVVWFTDDGTSTVRTITGAELDRMGRQIDVGDGQVPQRDVGTGDSGRGGGPR